MKTLFKRTIVMIALALPSSTVLAKTNTIAEWNTVNTTEMVLGMFNHLASNIEFEPTENPAWDYYAETRITCDTKAFDKIDKWMTLYSRSYTKTGVERNQYMKFDGNKRGRIQLECNHNAMTVSILDQKHKIKESLKVIEIVPTSTDDNKDVKK